MHAVISPAAQEDLLAQARYYAVDQGVPEVGLRFLDAVEAAVERISSSPAIGSPQAFEDPRLAGLRAWPVPGFDEIRLYYRANEGEILILRVLHDRRDVERHLRGLPPGG